MKPPLSDRELQVLKLIVHGYDRREVGLILGISHKTVERHKGVIFKFFNVHQVVPLIKQAILQEYIEFEEWITTTK